MNQSSQYKVLGSRLQSLLKRCIKDCQFENGKCVECGRRYSDKLWWDNADQHTRQLANQWLDNQIRERLINAKARIALRKLADVI